MLNARAKNYLRIMVQRQDDIGGSFSRSKFLTLETKRSTFSLLASGCMITLSDRGLKFLKTDLMRTRLAALRL
jgi:hypothetical protein